MAISRNFIYQQVSKPPKKTKIKKKSPVKKIKGKRK